MDDSDDNMLVIDEWHEDMEVSSTTPSKCDTPVRKIDDDITDTHENEADSSIVVAKIVDESPVVESMAKKSNTPITPSIKIKESVREIRKSKDERRKSMIHNSCDKKRTAQRRQYSIHVTNRISKENLLNVSILNWDNLVI